MNEHESHDRALRELIHEALSAPPLVPSHDLRRELEQHVSQLQGQEDQAMKVSLPEKEGRPVSTSGRGRYWLAASLATVLLLAASSVWWGPQVQLAWQGEDWRDSIARTELVSSGSGPAIREEERLDEVLEAEPKPEKLPSYLIAGTKERNKQLNDARTLSTEGLGNEKAGEAQDIPLAAIELEEKLIHDTDTLSMEGYGGGAAPTNLAKEVPGLQEPPGQGQGASARGSQGQETKGYSSTVRAKKRENSNEAKPYAQDAYGASAAPEAGDQSGRGVAPEALLGTKATPEEEAGMFSFAFGNSDRREGVSSAEFGELLKKKSELAAKETDLGPNHPDVAKLRKEVAETQRLLRELSDDGVTRMNTLAPGSEQYDPIYDNPFLPAKDAPLSTFSIDVDTASYANVRRFLMQGQLPPKNAVRIEELLNYFSYDYPAPKGEDPFSVNMETAPCPWQPEHLLLRVGLKGKDVHRAERPASNLVFLVDVSGSMSSEDKLPLLKQSLTMLTRELGENDKVTIVTYAGEAGLKMAPTNGSEKTKITAIIDSLSAGGSTHGSAGIQLAYQQARAAFVKEGTNRVILCTDGDLNVGITDDDALVKLITDEAKSGVFLTVLGFGTGNLKDSKMEKLADHGNGVYAYIDGLREARKVLVEQMSGSLVTIAKDVKLQIEFNPAQVRSYRLIGYENRVLAGKDFNDDKKDAGEIGAGHTVTALYELVPADAPLPKAEVDELKYQRAGSVSDRSQEEAGEQGSRGAGEKNEVSKELLTLKLRYKQPEGDVSQKIEYPLSERGTRFAQASADFRFAAAVAGFGMLLRDSPYRGGVTMSGVAEIAGSSLGEDKQGYRTEFLELVRRAGQLK